MKSFPHEPAKINYEVYSQKVSMNLKSFLSKLGIKSATPSALFEYTFFGTGFNIDNIRVIDNLPLGSHTVRHNINGEIFVDGVKIR
jgi:hypothetical protein